MTRTGEVLLVLRKEMTDLLRDRRSIFAMIVFPIVIHPILIFGSARLDAWSEERLEEKTAAVAVAGGIPELRERVVSAEGIARVRPEDPRGAVRAGTCDAALLLPDSAKPAGAETPEAVLLFNAAREASRQGKDRVVAVVDAWRRERRALRLDEIGAAHLSSLLVVTRTNLATKEKMAGGSLGKLLPFLIIFLLLNGASFAAVDLFAGERERKTIETLLTSPADRGAIVLGKFLTVVVSAITASVLFLASSYAFTMFRIGGSGGASRGLAVTLSSALVVLAVTLPLALLVAAVLVLVSIHARSYREAQTLLLPATLLAMVPAAFSLAPGVQLESIVAFLPVANVAVAVREALVGHRPAFFLALVALSNGVYAVVVLRAAKRYLASEGAILGRAAPPRLLPGEKPGRVREAAIFYAFEMLLLYYVGTFVQARSLLPGLLFTLWILLLAPTLLFGRRYGLSSGRDFALRRPALRHAAAGIFLAPAVLVGAQLLFRLQSRVLPVPEELVQAFEGLAEVGAGGWPLLLFAVAVSPGICEEFLFRGLLLGQHRRVMAPWRAALLGGFLFGLFHLSVYRLVPTAFLGTVAAALVLRTRSIVPAILLHIFYNGIALLAARGDGGGEGLEGPTGRWIAAGIAAAAVGLALLGGRKEAGGERTVRGL